MRLLEYNSNGQLIRDVDIPDEPEVANERQNEVNLDGSLFDNIRSIAQGSGTFANNVARDAAIRTCARGLVLVIRLLRKRNDAVD